MLSGGELAAKVAGFIAFAYLARVLTPIDYGAVELAASLAMFFTLLVDFGFGPIGAREVTRDRSKTADLAAAIPAARIGLALIGVVGMIGFAFIAENSDERRILLLIYAVSLLAAPWTLNWLFQALDRMPAVAIAQIVRMTIFAVGVVVFVKSPLDLWRVGVIEVGAVAAMAIYYLWAQQAFITPIRLRFHAPIVKHLFVEALPVGISRVVWALNQYLPMILVAVLIGGTEVAWFGAAHRIITGLGAFVFLYHFNLYPQLVRTVDAPVTELETLLESSFRVTAWMGVFVGLAGTMFANPLCRLVFGGTFVPAAPTLSLLVWVLPAALLGAHSRYVLIAYGHQRGELVASVVGAGVTIVLGAICIQQGGAVGAAFAMLVSTFVSWSVAQALARRRVGRVPYVLPLVRPGLAALFASGLSAWLPTESNWATGAVALGVYVIVAPLVDSDVRRIISALPQRLGKAREGAKPSLPLSENDKGR